MAQPAGWPAGDDAMSNLLAQNWWAIALRGVFAIIFGIIALLIPGAALLAFVLLFAAYMLVDGVLAIIAGIKAAKRHERWGWLVFEGILDLIAGGIAVVWPVLTIVAFVFLMGHGRSLQERCCSGQASASILRMAGGLWRSPGRSR
jgi:uncharacterized membrane protein HdeD (DUF308 family)